MDIFINFSYFRKITNKKKIQEKGVAMFKKPNKIILLTKQMEIGIIFSHIINYPWK